MADAAYDEQKKKPRSTKEVIKEFCSYTTTMGLEDWRGPRHVLAGLFGLRLYLEPLPCSSIKHMDYLHCILVVLCPR